MREAGGIRVLAHPGPGLVDSVVEALAARGLGLPVKLHADQLSDGGGAALAATGAGSAIDSRRYGPVPALGEHSDQIRAEFGGKR